jgi:flagellar biosynthetic protein FliQ
LLEETVVRIGREALLLTLVLSMPPIGLSMVVGLLISVFQAATQIQEQTLTFVPKMVAVFGLLAALGFWMVAQLVRFSYVLFASFPDVVG